MGGGYDETGEARRMCLDDVALAEGVGEASLGGYFLAANEVVEELDDAADAADEGPRPARPYRPPVQRPWASCKRPPTWIRGRVD
jgi:hypothetical protein